MKIEKLEPSRHRQGRWLVWLEDGSLVRLGEGEVVSLSLYSGKELTEEEGEALAAAEIQGRLNERAVALLSARPMSRRDLVDKLSAPARRRKKPSREADEVQPDPEALEREREALRQGAERAADWLEGLGLLNDGEYAGAVARHYAEKGYGPRKIQDELYRRGVPRAFWAEAMDGVSQGANVLDELLIRRLRGAEPTQENLKRACDYLARRGFSWEEIAQAVERYRRQGEE